MTTTRYAAIDATNITGTVYGVGNTPAAALAEALSVGSPCVGECEDRREDGHRPSDHFSVVPCTAGAAEFVARFGGAPDHALSVSARSGVSLREEE